MAKPFYWTICPHFVRKILNKKRCSHNFPRYKLCQNVRILEIGSFTFNPLCSSFRRNDLACFVYKICRILLRFHRRIHINLTTVRFVNFEMPVEVASSTWKRCASDVVNFIIQFFLLKQQIDVTHFIRLRILAWFSPFGHVVDPFVLNGDFTLSTLFIRSTCFSFNVFFCSRPSLTLFPGT